jgi:hypothetical protein
MTASTVVRCVNGHTLPPGRQGLRFCPACGVPMRVTCPAGHEVRPGRFCTVCGSSLPGGGVSAPEIVEPTALAAEQGEGGGEGGPEAGPAEPLMAWTSTDEGAPGGPSPAGPGPGRWRRSALAPVGAVLLLALLGVGAYFGVSELAGSNSLSGSNSPLPGGWPPATAHEAVFVDRSPTAC